MSGVKTIRLVTLRGVLQGCTKLHRPKHHQAPTLLKGWSGCCVLGIPLYLSKHIWALQWEFNSWFTAKCQSRGNLSGHRSPFPATTDGHLLQLLP